MGHDHESQRVSRRRLLAGVSSVGFGALVTACAGRNDAVTTSTGETVALQAVTDADLAVLGRGSGVRRWRRHPADRPAADRHPAHRRPAARR